MKYSCAPLCLEFNYDKQFPSLIISSSLSIDDMAQIVGARLCSQRAWLGSLRARLFSREIPLFHKRGRGAWACWTRDFNGRRGRGRLTIQQRSVAGRGAARVDPPNTPPPLRYISPGGPGWPHHFSSKHSRGKWKNNFIMNKVR